MTNETPLTTTPASAAVQEAFEAHYADLVEELTPVLGNESIATQAVDEAFRQAAALSDFEEYGRPHEWLLVMARNHVVRKPFRRHDLEDETWERSSGGFERPTLSASLDRARAARRREQARVIGWGTAAVAVGVALAVSVPQLVPWASTTSAPVAPSSSASKSSPPLIPSTTSSTPATEAWPPTVAAIIGHPSSAVAYTVVSSDTPGTKATVWQRCRYRTAGDSELCEMGENSALAVEVVDSAGHRMARLLEAEHLVRPAPKGAFAIVPMWGGDHFELISATSAKPFTLAAPVKPRPGQLFRECDAGPCILDLRGTVTPIDLPSSGPGSVYWQSDTSSGWLGWTDGAMGSTTVYVQQSDGSFGSVEISLRPPSLSKDMYVNGSISSDGAVMITAGNQLGFAQVAVSTDRGRTWQVRWANAGPFAPGDIDWRSLPIAKGPAISISALQRVS